MRIWVRELFLCVKSQNKPEKANHRGMALLERQKERQGSQTSDCLHLRGEREEKKRPHVDSIFRQMDKKVWSGYQYQMVGKEVV